MERGLVSASLSRIQYLALAKSASLAPPFEGERQLAEVFAKILASRARAYSLLKDGLSKMSEKGKLKIVWDKKSLEAKLGLVGGQ